jgi:hypothetical protein
MPYMRAPSADTYASTVPPGSYELVYRRSSDGAVVSQQFMGDPVINGERVLESCVRVP